MTRSPLNTIKNTETYSQQCPSLKRGHSFIGKTNQPVTEKLCDQFTCFDYRKKQLQVSERSGKRRKIPGFHLSEVDPINIFTEQANNKQKVNMIKELPKPPSIGESFICEPIIKLESILKEITGTPMKTYQALELQDFFIASTPEQITAYTSAVITAVQNQDIATLREMQKKGVTLQCCNRFGESIIHMACRRGAMKVVRFLLEEARVSFLVRDDYGRTPLHDAFWAAEPQVEIAKMLVTICPDLLMISDKRGFIPISYVRKEHWGLWCKFLEENRNILPPKELLLPANH